MHELKDILVRGAKQLDISMNEEQQQLLLNYVELLNKWNKAFNLTAVRDPKEMMVHHILDSLAIHPYVEGQRLLDVGSGPGLPSVPLSIMNPDKYFVSLDSNGKKTRFVQQAIHSLKLKNIEVVQARIETFEVDELFDGIMSRAFASLNDFIQGCRHLLKQDGQLLAMKGLVPHEEIKELDSNISITKTIDLSVPGLEKQRHLLLINL